MSTIAENIRHIRQIIEGACASSERDPADVNLVAVSKMQDAAAIQEALDAGQRLFGENRVQEAEKHWTEARVRYPDLKLHLIGPLQTNKVHDAVALFDVIETVDRPALVDALAKEMAKQGRHLPCFVQVNTGAEDQKAGVGLEELPSLLAYAVDKKLTITGLMCIPPVDQPPALHFALLKKLADRHGLRDLSMGMSADFEKAIPLGATYVRVGTALFGAR